MYACRAGDAHLVFFRLVSGLLISTLVLLCITLLRIGLLDFHFHCQRTVSATSLIRKFQLGGGTFKKKKSQAQSAYKGVRGYVHREIFRIEDLKYTILLVLQPKIMPQRSNQNFLSLAFTLYGPIQQMLYVTRRWYMLYDSDIFKSKLEPSTFRL